VPGIDPEQFEQIAQTAKQSCPLSKVLSAAEITLSAKLLSEQNA
jgi:osmotically inducible protein OsmC